MKTISEEMVNTAKNGITNSLSDALSEIDILQTSVATIKEDVSNLKVVWNSTGGNDKSTMFNDIVGYLETYSQEIANFVYSLYSEELPSILIDTAIKIKDITK
ncbi:MAG: hypothetical protein ACI4P7_07035 [Bacilli bacterium]|nr:hypothetical protein [Erysipelotrichaceae bacterium]